MGALMGTGVGLTVGFIFGSYSIMRSVERFGHGWTVPDTHRITDKAQVQEASLARFLNICLAALRLWVSFWL
jgi:hypothetical protein